MRHHGWSARYACCVPSPAMKTLKLATPIFVGLLLAGCVSQGQYDHAVDEGQQALTNANGQTARAQARARELEQELNATQGSLESERGQRAGLEAEKKDLSAAIDADNAKLDELTRARAAAESRAALFREVAAKLAHMIDSGDIAVVLRDGRMVIRLPDDVLFDSGSVEIKPRGRAALHAVASVIKPIASDRHFQVAGHTDNVPIGRALPYASNWDLSTARAVRVVKFLLEDGVTPAALSAAGYADVDPVASNGTADGRHRNRRTEITLLPNIDEIVRVPEK
jgi:chemotaxis protein MotB